MSYGCIHLVMGMLMDMKILNTAWQALSKAIKARKASIKAKEWMKIMNSSDFLYLFYKVIILNPTYYPITIISTFSVIFNHHLPPCTILPSTYPLLFISFLMNHFCMLILLHYSSSSSSLFFTLFFTLFFFTILHLLHLPFSTSPYSISYWTVCSFHWYTSPHPPPLHDFSFSS